MTPTRDALERIAVALERIADNMDAERVLAEKRKVKAAQQARYRASKNAVATTVDATERKQEGKEGKSPHTPLKGEIQEKKKDTPQRGRARVDGFEDLFERFWTAYPGPRKTDKRKCREKFAAILRESGEPDAMLRRMLDGIDRWRKSRDWSEDGGAYICAPLVWLNNERWDAEVAPATGGRGAVDPKSAAFERNRAECEARRHNAIAILNKLERKGGAA